MQREIRLERKNLGDESMLTNENFEFLRKKFTEGNSELANDPEAIQKTMDDFEKDILVLLEEKPESFEIAILILLEMLNFLARFSGVPEFLTPDFGEVNEEITFPSPIESKYSAVFVADKRFSPFYRSISQVFETCINPEALRYKLYTDVKELMKDILEGLVCGVVAFQLDNRSSIEGHLRHDLKYMPGFNYELAEQYVFPVCLNFAPPHKVFEIIGIMAKFQDGSYQSIKQDEDFQLTDILPSLIAHMYVPAQKKKILIVDDVPKEIMGMEIILDAWPNIERSTVIQREKEMPEVPDDIDILLLDEGMKITGTQVAAHLQDSKFPGLIASTTGGKKPSHTHWHFGAKRIVSESYSIAKEFVSFVNVLLQTK